MDSPENPAVSSTASTPTGFQPEVMGIYLSGTGTLGPVPCGLASDGDHCLPRYPSQFLSTTTCECGTTHSLPLCASPPISATLPLLPVWMSVASLNPWLWDFCTARFSDSCGHYLFWDRVVILSVVVGGGKACLPMSPS